MVLVSISPDNQVMKVDSGAFQTFYDGLHRSVEDPLCRFDAKGERQKTDPSKRSVKGSVPSVFWV